MTRVAVPADEEPPASVLPRGPGVLRFGAAGFANALAQGFFYPFALLFYTHLSGQPLRSVGTVLTVTALAALPGLLLIGRLVDRLGCRPVLVTALVLRALCFVGFVSFRGLLPLALGCLLLAAASRAEQAAAPLLAFRLAPEGQQSRWLALSRVVFNAGMGTGAVLAGVFLVDTAAGYAALGVVNAVGLCLTAVLYATLPALSPASAEPGGSGPGASRSPAVRPWRNRRFLRVSAVNALLLTSALAVESGLPVFVLRRLSLPAWTVGLLFAVNTVMLTVLQLPVSRFLDRYRPGAVLALGGLSYVGLYAALTLSAGAGRSVQVTLLVCGMAVYTLGELAVTQAALVLLTGIPPQSQQGGYLAFNQVFIGGSTAVAPLLVTNVLSLQPMALWPVLAGVSVVSALLLLPDARNAQAVREPALPRPTT